jgi:hypothetical protein
MVVMDMNKPNDKTVVMNMNKVKDLELPNMNNISKLPALVTDMPPKEKMPDNNNLTKKYQMTISEGILLHGICKLIQSYQNDLDTDEDLLENEKYQLNRIINDFRELLEEVEKLY